MVRICQLTDWPWLRAEMHPPAHPLARLAAASHPLPQGGEGYIW